LSRVFRLEDRNIGSVWIPPFEVATDAPLKIDVDGTIEQAMCEADEIRERAQQEAASILENAKLKSIEDCEQAKRSGFEQGFKEGYASGLEEAQKLAGQAQDALDSCRDTYDRYLKKAEPKLLALALEVARKIVGESLTYDPDLIFSMLRQGIEAIGDARKFSLHVNPQLVALLEGGKEKLQGQYSNRSIEVIGDESISEGAVVETPTGHVDATLDAQITNIARAIGEARNRLGERGVQ
jgi:flagellar assembly protein FliH